MSQDFQCNAVYRYCTGSGYWRPAQDIDFPPLADHTLDILPGHLLFRRFKDLLSRAASVIFSADPLTPLFWNG